MSLSYFPMYPADFEAKTSHLTLEEDGAYNRLLRLMWMTPGCSLPDDPAWIARRMRCDAATYERVVIPLIEEFLKRRNGRVYSPRLVEEFEKVSKTYKLRVEAGKLGGRPKAIENKQYDEKAGLTIAKGNRKQPEPEPELEKKERDAIASPKKADRGSRLASDWQLPEGWRQWAADQGLAPIIIQREADRFRDYWIGKSGKDAVKADWQATWRNWMRKRIEDQAPRSAPQTDFWTGKVLAQ